MVRIGLLATALACLATLGGCATAMTMRAGAADDRSSPTKSIAILYEERIPSESVFRRYELYPDGTLKIGGGRVAMEHKTDWSGRPTDDELDAILVAAEDARLASGPPACTPALVDGSETISVLVEYASPTVSQSYALEGRCPTLAPLRDAFERAGLARFKRQLDALPEGGKQPNRSAR